MSKVPANTFLLLRKQAYSVGAENVRAQVAVAAEKKNTATAVEYSTSSSTDDMKGIAEQNNATVDHKEILPLAAGKKQEECWMRDPKTGNWMPETHISEVDAADLRDKFLPNKAKDY